MITFFVAFLVSLMVAAVLTLVVRNRAVAYGWVEQARSSRKIHSRPIPRLGGIAIVAGFFAPLIALLFVDSSVGETFQSQPTMVVGLFVGGTFIVALGLYDDFKGAGARKKFSVQFLVAAVLYALGFRIDNIANPFGDPIQLGYFGPVFTLIWMVGVINAMNLIDGLDGLAGGVAFFAVGTNFVLAVARADVLMSLMMAALGGAILGFLIFNFNPASIFMGDTGSMFLGFVLAAVSIKTSAKSGTAVSMLVPIIALGLPIMDTLLAMIRRALLGRSMFSADKDHIHHRLMNRLAVSHRRAVLVLYGLSCVFALTALALAYANSAQTAMLLVGMGVVVAVLMRKLGYLTLERAGQVGQARARNIQLRSLVNQTIGAIERSSTLVSIWYAIRPIAQVMGASRLELRIEGRSLEGQRDGVVFETQREGGTALPLEIRVDLGEPESKTGQLVVSWRDGRAEVDRDEELALEMIADAASAAVIRVTLEAEAGPGKVVVLRK